MEQKDNMKGSLVTGGTPPSEATQMLHDYWPQSLEQIQHLTQDDFKQQELPLARIKKIMKLDEDVKMISAEAPLLFAKAAELFISELSIRAWVHTEDNKRRTLQRNDIAMAITKNDTFDFLIDIVPREEIKPAQKTDTAKAAVGADQVHYYFQLAQQHQAVLQQQQTQTPTTQPQTITLQAPGGQVLQQPIQLQIAGNNALQVPTVSVNQAGEASQQQQQQQHQQQQQVIQIQAPAATVQQQPQQAAQVQTSPAVQQSTSQTTQVVQQVVTPSGEIQQIPIQLTPQQLQALTMQMQGKQPGQPIVIQTLPNTAAQNQGQGDQQAQQQFSTQPLFQIQNLGQNQVYLQQPGAGDGGEQAQLEAQDAS